MKKIEYAVGATGVFIQALHRENFDRGMIATFGERFQLIQPLTGREGQLKNALGNVLGRVGERRTRLYDSLEDVVRVFLRDASPGRPKLLTVITDGMDNASAKFKGNPAGIGRFIHNAYSKETLNFMFVIGVGSNHQVDARGLGQMGDAGEFLAMRIDAFPLLMEVYLKIAIDVTSHIEGRRRSNGRMTWDEIAEVYRVSETPLDYGFLIDVSDSMNEPGDISQAQMV